MNTENLKVEMPAEGYIGKAEVARRLGRTARTVENWMGRGILPYYKLGRTVAFRWSEVEEHLRANHRVCLGQTGRFPRLGQSVPLRGPVSSCI